MKKTVSLLLALLIVSSMAACRKDAKPVDGDTVTPSASIAAATDSPATKEPTDSVKTIKTKVASQEDIDKYGDIILEITSGDMAALGYKYADLVSVSFLDKTITIPVIPEYRYVGSKASGLVMWEEAERPVTLEIFNGDFAEFYGVASRMTNADGSRYHVAKEGVEFPVEFTISMHEPGGYADTYAIYDLTRTDARQDYEALDDAQFANFRMITTSGVGAGKLFRSSSPINPSIGRNLYADAASAANGIKTFVNLADSEDSAKKYEGYSNTYYAKQNAAFLDLGVDFTSELNRAGVAETMKFLSTAEAPVLIHCNEGQDRAGFISALLECLMGASADEVIQDYMVTFYNYYGVKAGTDQYNQIAANVVKNLKNAFGVENFEKAELASEAEEYLLELGVSRDEIDSVRKLLGGESVRLSGKVVEIEKYGHALLDIKIEDFNKAGFELGDIVTVAAGSYTSDMPYFNGYYVDKGSCMLRAYPGHENIAVCINYGKFAETAGIDVNSTVTITLKQKAGALLEQQVNSLVYTNDRADYDDDATFANFREITTSGMGKGKLYRSASPVNNQHGRAAIANKLVKAVAVKTVMNLADTDEELRSYLNADNFDSAYYKELCDKNDVVALGMPINFASEEFASGIVKGLTFLSEHEGPYLVHCTEGKDRAGFTAMLLEALMGANLDEIVNDYMLSYVNYYHLDKKADAEKYNMIAEKNVLEMLRAVAKLDKNESLEDIDFAAAAEEYLRENGMSKDAITALKSNLK